MIDRDPEAIHPDDSILKPIQKRHHRRSPGKVVTVRVGVRVMVVALVGVLLSVALLAYGAIQFVEDQNDRHAERVADQNRTDSEICSILAVVPRTAETDRVSDELHCQDRFGSGSDPTPTIPDAPASAAPPRDAPGSLSPTTTAPNAPGGSDGSRSPASASTATVARPSSASSSTSSTAPARPTTSSTPSRPRASNSTTPAPPPSAAVSIPLPCVSLPVITVGCGSN